MRLFSLAGLGMVLALCLSLMGCKEKEPSTKFNLPTEANWIELGVTSTGYHFAVDTTTIITSEAGVVRYWLGSKKDGEIFGFSYWEDNCIEHTTKWLEYRSTKTPKDDFVDNNAPIERIRPASVARTVHVFVCSYERL